ncbi:uncharacterized protein [Hoplias malabaricus]|uniref:uncharacterized protein isoform X2 n=1 Tax=Hoplias malabaricus TaxID=27720 RepID=UPI0034624477
MRCFIFLSLMIMKTASPPIDDHILPADIFGSTTVKAGENITLKCSIIGKNVASKLYHMYLCKNGAGVRIEQLQNKEDFMFVLGNVSVLDSGNYSCVYSEKKIYAKNVTASGQRSIYVQVIENSLITKSTASPASTKSQKNMTTSENVSGYVQSTGDESKPSMEKVLIALFILLLVGILLLGIYYNRTRIFSNACQNQEQRQANSEYTKVSEPETQAVHRTDSINDMLEYSTIPEFIDNTCPAAVCNAEGGVYSLTQFNELYSLAEHNGNLSDIKTSTAIYGKVQKQKKAKAHDEFLMYQ